MRMWCTRGGRPRTRPTPESARKSWESSAMRAARAASCSRWPSTGKLRIAAAVQGERSSTDESAKDGGKVRRQGAAAALAAAAAAAAEAAMSGRGARSARRGRRQGAERICGACALVNDQIIVDAGGHSAAQAERGCRRTEANDRRRRHLHHRRRLPPVCSLATMAQQHPAAKF